MNNTPTKKRGGPQPGSGRPPKDPADKVIKCKISMTQADHAATEGDRSRMIRKALEMYFSQSKTKTMYFVATVSDTVQGNFIAHALTESKHGTKEAAKEAADALWVSIQSEFEARPDFGEGAVIGKSVIVHDGAEVLPI